VPDYVESIGPDLVVSHFCYSSQFVCRWAELRKLRDLRELRWNSLGTQITQMGAQMTPMNDGNGVTRHQPHYKIND
jgi:hypothetical protein